MSTSLLDIKLVFGVISSPYLNANKYFIDTMGAKEASQQSKVEEDQALSQLYSTKVLIMKIYVLC